MANYHIKKSAALQPDTSVYYVEGNRWSDDFEDRKIFSSKTTANNTMSNADGTNGGFSGASIVTE